MPHRYFDANAWRRPLHAPKPKHFASCFLRQDIASTWSRWFPNSCADCEAWGSNFELEPCQTCVGQNKCGRCGDKLRDGQCVSCSWTASVSDHELDPALHYPAYTCKCNKGKAA